MTGAILLITFTVLRCHRWITHLTSFATIDFLWHSIATCTCSGPDSHSWQSHCLETWVLHGLHDSYPSQPKQHTLSPSPGPTVLGGLGAAAPPPIQKPGPCAPKWSSPHRYFNRSICYCITRITGASLSVVNCAPVCLHGPSIAPRSGIPTEPPLLISTVSPQKLTVL